MKLKERANALVVGGTSGVGREIARELAGEGCSVHITGRNVQRVESVAQSLPGDVRGLALDLAQPSTLAGALDDIDQLDYLVLAATERDSNSVDSYDIESATRSIVVKTVGFAEIVHLVKQKLTSDSAILLFGGAAFQRPSLGSLTTATMGAGVVGLGRALATQMGPVRVNVIHPGVIGDSDSIASAWGDERMAGVAPRTPIGRLVTTEEVVDAAMFLLSNTGLSGVDLTIDGGWLLT